MAGIWRAVLFMSALALVARCEEGEDELPPDDAEEVTDHGQLSEGQLHTLHGRMDGNADGKVSMAEIMQFSDDMRKRIAGKDVAEVLESMDADKDGKLSSAEFAADMQHWGEGEQEDKEEAKRNRELELAKFKVADSNKDGLLDLQELPALFYPETHEGVLELAAKATLGQKDTNGDGLLDATELWEGEQVEGAEGEEPTASNEEKSDFQKLDKDGDGKLNLEELKLWESGRFHTEKAMTELIELADKDSDKQVTATELSGALERITSSDAQYPLLEWAEHLEL